MAIVEQSGSLWDYYQLGYRIVVPTAVGWSATSRRAPMRSGIAALVAGLDEPAVRSVAAWYGRHCKQEQVTRRREMPVIEHRALRLIFLPVRPLVSEADSDRDDQAPTIGLVRRSLDQLLQLCERGGGPTIAMSLAGLADALPRATVRQAVEQRLEPYTVGVLGRSKRLVLVANELPALGNPRSRGSA